MGKQADAGPSVTLVLKSNECGPGPEIAVAPEQSSLAVGTMRSITSNPGSALPRIEIKRGCPAVASIKNLFCDPGNHSPHWSERVLQLEYSPAAALAD